MAMNFAIQRCCNTSVYLEQYETSTDAVLNSLGVDIVDIKEFNCCGYPYKNINFKAYILSSARNLSLAEKRELDIITFCNCCYGTLKHVNHILKENNSLKDEVNKTLGKEGLVYDGNVEIKHLLEILYKDIGISKIKEKIVQTFKGLRVAAHYGCHILRPNQLVQFDEPGTASIFDECVQITGAEIISWQEQLECCGSPLWGVDDELSMDLTLKKIKDARQGGADYLCVACSFCQLQFDRVQNMLLEKKGNNHGLPSVLYTQLLGLSLGIDENKLGIQKNELGADGLKGFL
jgi:heterodisulfide reductase subunit B